MPPVFNCARREDEQPARAHVERVEVYQLKQMIAFEALDGKDIDIWNNPNIDWAGVGELIETISKAIDDANKMGLKVVVHDVKQKSSCDHHGNCRCPKRRSFTKTCICGDAAGNNGYCGPSGCLGAT